MNELNHKFNSIEQYKLQIYKYITNISIIF